MNQKGVKKAIDNLGRLVIPSEMRSALDIEANDKVELFLAGDSIVLKKYTHTCAFCGGEEGLVNFKSKKVCRNCAAELGKL